MHPENPRTTLTLSTTPGGHHEVDLLIRTKHTAGVDSLDKLLSVKVLAKDGIATALTPVFVSELLSHGLQLGMCLSQLSSSELVNVERDRPLCIVMSPTESRELDLVVEIATTQLRNGRLLTDSSLNYNRSLEGLRSIRGIHAAVADCGWCWSVCAEGQAGNCSVCGICRARGVRRHPRSRPLFGAVNSETLTQSRPYKKQRLDTSSLARTGGATNFGSCTKLRIPCLRSVETSPVWHDSSPWLKFSLFCKDTWTRRNCQGGSQENGRKLCMWFVKALCTL